MAKEYILLIDEEKYSNTLSCKYPIALEVIKDSLSYVIKNVKKSVGSLLLEEAV